MYSLIAAWASQPHPPADTTLAYTSTPPAWGKRRFWLEPTITKVRMSTSSGVSSPKVSTRSDSAGQPISRPSTTKVCASRCWRSTSRARPSGQGSLE